MEQEATTYLLNQGTHLIRFIPKAWDDFRAFIKRGSFFDVATAIVVGGAFTSVVTSFVDDLFTPVVSIVLTRRLSEMFLLIKSGPSAPYKTREQAIADGAVTLNYGNFIQTSINFFILSFSFYLIFKFYTRLHRDFDDNLSHLLQEVEPQHNDNQHQDPLLPRQ